MGIRSVLRQARAQGWRDDTVEYAIFPDPDSFELPPPAPGQEAAGEEAVRRGLEALRVAGERGREGAPPHLYGRTRYGACVDDEWLVAWLLLAISARLPFLSIRSAASRTSAPAPPALPPRLAARALAAVRSAHEPTEASEKIHRAVMRRLEGLPGTALAAVHTARCRLPIRAAQVLHLDPSLVPLAAHAFLQSDHGSSTSPAPSFSRHSSSLPLFLPHSSCPCALASSRPGAPPCTTSPTPPPTAPSRAPPCTALVDVMRHSRLPRGAHLLPAGGRACSSPQGLPARLAARRRQRAVDARRRGRHGAQHGRAAAPHAGGRRAQGGRGKKGGGVGDGMGEKGREGKSGKGGKQGKEGAEGEEEAGELVERLKQFLERASGFEGVEAGRDGDGSESGESEEGERGASEEEERRDGREEVERLREFELFMEDLEGVMAQYSHDEVKGFRGFRGDGSSEDEEDEGSESAFFSEPGSDSEWEDASHTGSLEGEGEESGEEEERGVGLPHEAVAGSGGAADAVGGGRAAQRAGRGAAAGGLRRGFLGAGGAPGGMQVVEERREEGEMRRRDKGKGKVVEEAVKEGRAGGASSGGVAGGDDFYALYSAAMAAQLAKTNVPKTSLALPPTHEQRSKLSSAASSSRAGRAAPGRAGEREAEAEAEAERVVGHLRMAQQLQGGLPGPADVLLDAVGAGKRGRGGRGKRGGRKGRR
ncbi:hypothetical protein CLOM_g7855 [Closterium sp. NIES-68]|nr:hypothetical protein CLOM_g7855 [Closterium sp. NIES-68]